MNIGKKLKDLRIRHDLTMQELADRCNLSKGYISQLEHNFASPSIETLNDILKIYDITLATFFTKTTEPEKFVFKKNDFIVATADCYDITWLIPKAQKLELEPIIINLKPFGVSKTILPFQGQIFGYVLKGTVTVCYGNKLAKAKENECFIINGVENHYLKNETPIVTTILWISHPPLF